MATMRITDVFELGLLDEHSGTTWQASTDNNFAVLLLNNENDQNNLLSYRTIIRNADNTLFDFSIPLYFRVKLHYKEYETDWYNLGTCDTNNNIYENTGE